VQAPIDQGGASVKRRLAELEAQFCAATRNRGGHVKWRSAMDFPARFVAAEARCADIIVSGGQSPAFSDAFSLASPKDLVMQAGRPLPRLCENSKLRSATRMIFLSLIQKSNALAIWAPKTVLNEKLVL
jgi:hypothetical protein